MLTICLASLLIGCGAPQQTPAPFDSTYRWFILEANLRQSGDVDKSIKAIEAAGAAGYNGVVFQDPTFDELSKIPSTYVAALTQVMGEAKKAHLEFIPSIAPIGAAASLLLNNPSLAESMPSKNVRFTVTGGKLKPSDSAPPLANPGFDTFAGDLPTGFKAAAHPGVAAFMDTAMKHGGAASLRIEGQASTQPNQNVMYEQSVAVLPWHPYRLSIWTKTAASAGCSLTLTPKTMSGQELGYSMWKETPDWTKSVIVFNSQENTQINLQLVVHPTPTTKIWIDDMVLENIGLLNVTRRDDCPILIRGDDGTIYSEFLDIDEIKDTFVPPGTSTPKLELTHDPVMPVVLGNSHLHEGQTVILDYYSALLVDNNPSLCLAESRSKTLVRDEVKRIVSLTHPHILFFNIDKVKALGWDPGCDTTASTPSKILSGFLRDQAGTLKAIDPTMQLATFSNMFDPNENAKESYFFVKGGFSNSISGVPKNTIILNDDSPNAIPSLGYFGRLGYTQVLIGSAESRPGFLTIDKWEKAGSGIVGIKGFCYMSPTGDYSHLADFAHLALGP